MINLDLFDIELAKKSIKEDGFYIAKKLIDQKIIKEMQFFWKDYYKNINHSNLQRVQWNPYLGEPNKVGYSEDKDQLFYRTFDFFWNKPIHKLTKDVVSNIRKLTISLVEEDIGFGNLYTDDRYGIYATSSYYPANRGFLREHSDSNKNKTLIHHIIPLTFLNEDYNSGGLFLKDRKGNKIEIDSLVSYGDVIFYDGLLPHGVNKIMSDNEGMGRIQIFAIPTNFEYPTESKVLFDDLKKLELIKNLIRLPFRKLKKKFS